jgi:PAS domain S-box-containing protein
MAPMPLPSWIVEETHPLRRQSGLLAVIGLALVAALDAVLPPGYTAPLLYIPVVVLGLFAAWPRMALTLAALATGLTVLDPLVWGASASRAMVVFDRSLVIAMIWVTAVGVTMYRTMVERRHESLRALEDMKQALDQSAIVATTDVPGRIKFVNDKFCEISKYAREELIGQDHRLLNSGFHEKAFIRDLWRTIAQGRVWRGELRNRAKDGSIYWVDTTIVPFLDARGKPWQYMAIRYDITARKAHEQRLRDQAALAALGEFAAVVAHEVRNPLAGIRNGVQLIAADLPAGSEAASLSGAIVARVDSLNTVIEDLLTFARPREFRPSPLAVRAFLADLVNGFRQDPAMQRVVVQIDAPEEITIEADADQLRLVFANLLMNAGQAIDGDGTIAVRITRSGDEACAIEIGDSGPGVPAEVRDRVFEPFFTTKRHGTGLGLPTVKRIVDAHAGQIALVPGAGGGTVARVVLPIRQQPTAPA